MLRKVTIAVVTFSSSCSSSDHSGVSNAQLVKESVPIASKYKERSVAEQNSLDLSWNLLMSPKYKTLRSVLLPQESDMVRFRQLVVNSVMATGKRKELNCSGSLQVCFVVF